MTTLEDVLRAHATITEAEEVYRRTLRSALNSGVKQKAIADRLGVSAEKLRQDAMTEAERQALRQADADRKTALRTAAKGSAPTPDGSP